MLKFALARSLCDKDSFVTESIKSSLKNENKKVILLVPEQASFEPRMELGCAQRA